MAISTYKLGAERRSLSHFVGLDLYFARDVSFVMLELNGDFLTLRELIHGNLPYLFELVVRNDTVTCRVVNSKNDVTAGTFSLWLEVFPFDPPFVVRHFEFKVQIVDFVAFILSKDQQFLDRKHSIIDCECSALWFLFTKHLHSFIASVVVVFAPVHVEAEVLNDLVRSNQLFLGNVNILTIVEQLVCIQNVFQITLSFLKEFGHFNWLWQVVIEVGLTIGLIFMKEECSSDDHELAQELTVKAQLFDLIIVSSLPQSNILRVIWDPASNCVECF